MKIYKVSYIGEDDNVHNSYYSNKEEANKEYKHLNKIQLKEKKIREKNNQLLNDEYGIETTLVKCLFDLHIFECDISKKGILNMLNRHFKEE